MFVQISNAALICCCFSSWCCSEKTKRITKLDDDGVVLSQDFQNKKIFDDHVVCILSRIFQNNKIFDEIVVLFRAELTETLFRFDVRLLWYGHIFRN